MSYDLLITNGRVIDGTGSPAFNADVGIRNGRIAAIGKLSGALKGAAKRTIDARGQVIAPGFIDSHTHFDAQVIWDPMCTWSCYHGVTTVITGNCSLGIAPLRPGDAQRIYEYLSYVEAIPMETLMTVKPTWQTFGQYMDTIDQGLGLNVGPLVGHTPIRHYVMRGESQGERVPSADEIRQMQDLVREAMDSGALGLSFSLNKGHYDPQGVEIPSVWAKEDEMFALASVLGDMGTGVLQLPSCSNIQEKNRLMSRLSESIGRPVIHGQLASRAKQPDYYKFQIEVIEESMKNGHRAIPFCSPLIVSDHFDMHNCQMFKGVPSWHQVLVSGTDEEKLAAYADREFRKKVHHDIIDWSEAMAKVPQMGKNWPDVTWVRKVKLDKNKQYEDLSMRELAEKTGKGIIDAFLDLVVEEQLDTRFEQAKRGADVEIMSKILTYPNALIGMADSGAHVQFHGGYGFAAVLLGHWVRKHKIMSVEAAVKKLTFDQAQAFQIYDRGLLQPGMAADVVVFDPDTIRCLPDEKVYDLPGGAWRLKELADGILCAVVNGQVILEDGKLTGARPGKVLRNSRYRQREEEAALATA